MLRIRTMRGYVKAAILWICFAPLIVQARSLVNSTRGESNELTQLLQDASDEAQQLAIDAQDTQTLVSTDKNWITHALALAKIKGHVENMSLIIDKLSNAQKSGSEVQEEAVQRIIPLVKELSANTQAAISYLNQNKDRPISETYKEYLKKNAETARQLASVVEALFDYEKSMSEIHKLRHKLTNEPQATRPRPMSQTQTHPQRRFFMAAQNDQKALQTPSGERRDNPRQTALSSQRGPAYLGLGITPQEFISSNPFALLRRMSEEMDRVFQEFGLERDGESKVGWSPAIEIVEKDGKLNIRAELPGLSADDVKIETTNDALAIHGERKVEHEENRGGVRRSERQYGFFYRSIPLPEGADVEHASAKFQNGMLEISIPVPEQKESRRSIPIEGQLKPREHSQKQAA